MKTKAGAVRLWAGACVSGSPLQTKTSPRTTLVSVRFVTPSLIAMSKGAAAGPGARSIAHVPGAWSDDAVVWLSW